MDTTLCALQLEVYYRHLPTFKTLDETPAEDVKPDPSDLKIDISSVTTVR
jgi:hypothetical protein